MIPHRRIEASSGFEWMAFQTIFIAESRKSGSLNALTEPPRGSLSRAPTVVIIPEKERCRASVEPTGSIPRDRVARGQQAGDHSLDSPPSAGPTLIQNLDCTPHEEP